MVSGPVPQGYDVVEIATGPGFKPDMLGGGRDVSVQLDKLKEEWAKVSYQVNQVIGATPPAPTGFDLDEIDVALALKASGKIGFIAEASAEAGATFTVKFARRK